MFSEDKNYREEEFEIDSSESGLKKFKILPALTLFLLCILGISLALNKEIKSKFYSASISSFNQIFRAGQDPEILIKSIDLNTGR